MATIDLEKCFLIWSSVPYLILFSFHRYKKMDGPFFFFISFFLLFCLGVLLCLACFLGLVLLSSSGNQLQFCLSIRMCVLFLCLCVHRYACSLTGLSPFVQQVQRSARLLHLQLYAAIEGLLDSLFPACLFFLATHMLLFLKVL